MARGGVNDGADAALAQYARESHPWSPGDGASATTLARFRSAPARLAPDDACAVRVVEDVAAFAGGPVWRIDWCPKRPADGGGGAYLAVEAGGARGKGGAGGWERGEDGSEIGTGNGATMGSNHHATSFDELGRVSGAGVVQIWRLRAAATPEAGATTGGAPSGGKRKRSGQPTRNESNEGARGAGLKGGGSEARCVLCLSHDGGIAWDLRWSPAVPPSGTAGGDTAGDALGTLAVALGDGRVEAWTVVAPETGNNESTMESPRLVKPRRILRGAVPRECGVALALDWSPCGRKIAAACSGGAVCVWDVRAGDGECATSFPSFVIGDDARRPQRCVAWVPPDASDADRGGADRGGADRGVAQMDGRLIASAGHGMAAPAVYSLDDPFKPVAGARGLTFSGAGATLSMDWPRTAGAAAVTGTAEGTVRLHDFFSKRSVHARRGDTADTSNSKAVAWGTSRRAEGVGGGRSRQATDKEHEMSVRGVWCVATKPVGDAGVALVCVGTGAAGIRVAAVHAGHGARRTNGRNKRTAIDAGAPVDLVPLGGHARATDGGGSGDASRVTLTAFGQRTTRGPGSLGGDATVVSAVRCARWLDSNEAIVAGGEDAWLAWGDDAGFVRFQRVATRGLLDVERAMEKLATMN